MGREEVLVISSQETKLRSHQPRSLIMSYCPHDKRGYDQQIGTRTTINDKIKQQKIFGSGYFVLPPLAPPCLAECSSSIAFRVSLPT